MKEKVIARE